MKRLSYQKTVNPRRLYTELVQIPGLAPVNQVASFTLLAGVNETVLHVPDNINEVQVAGVIQAHDGTPDPGITEPDFGNDPVTHTGTQLADAVTNLRAYLGLASPTNAQTIAAFKLLIRVVLFLVRRLVIGQ